MDLNRRIWVKMLLRMGAVSGRQCSHEDRVLLLLLLGQVRRCRCLLASRHIRWVHLSVRLRHLALHDRVMVQRRKLAGHLLLYRMKQIDGLL